MSNSREAERKVNENIDKAAGNAQDEVSRLRHELDDLRRRAGPKIDEAESFLTSPTALGFYQGLVVGVAIVLGYAKYNGGLRL
ncbi:hypothetical protein BCR43DRAFT_521675 [Syncephalastrum racemosum]|uniref:Uncharacterized protein n=1 Tax=Syncephalastrum racemosum TaxID=13706 RepID=A0A1X2HP78_SYNRA|nr:hypothetical protein BCR43DRAFT_521675 [Syncephalastrum racemosum]